LPFVFHTCQVGVPLGFVKGSAFIIDCKGYIAWRSFYFLRRSENMAEQFLDSVERDFQYSLLKVPLWKESWKKHCDASGFSLKCRPLISCTQSEQNEEQEILAHIVQQRQKEGLPSFFALLSGPTFLKFRMEALSLVLGRNTATSRDADISLGDNKCISRRHVLIEYNREREQYFAKVLSKNPISVIHQDGSKTQLTKDDPPFALRNPTVFDIQGVIVFFQIFYIRDEQSGLLRLCDVVVQDEESHKVAHQISLSTSHDTNQSQKDKEKERERDAKEEVNYESSLAMTASMAQTKKNGNRKKEGISYAKMIETAINANGGKARYSDIIAYIEENFKDVISTRRTWKNSIGGVLSSNEKFIPEVGIQVASESGKRNRGSWWRMRTPDDPPPESAPGVSTSAAKKRQRQLQFQQAQETRNSKKWRPSEKEKDRGEDAGDDDDDETLMIDESVSQCPQKKQRT
jgi:hypothetical protein